MYSAVTSSLTKRLTPIFQTAVRSALTLAILSALLVVATARSQAQTESVLYSFAGKPDGANPRSPLVFNAGNLYGTTYNGGLYGFGTVFELTPNGTGGWTEKILYNFCPASPSCTDGENPTFAKLLFDSSGNIYGTAFAGGALGNGAVFELSSLGSS